MIVGTLGANREQLGPCANEQHLLIADMPHQPVIDESGQRNTLRKVRAAGRSCSWAIVAPFTVRQSFL